MLCEAMNRQLIIAFRIIVTLLATVGVMFGLSFSPGYRALPWYVTVCIGLAVGLIGGWLGERWLHIHRTKWPHYYVPPEEY
jgi:hypothetical protein